MTGWSLTSVPSVLDAPMTWPPLTPPPARATLKTLGKWSRPALGLILGVRPNSPIQTTSVWSSMPRCFRSVIRVAKPGSTWLGELADFFVVLLVGVPAVGADLDERDAGLDQPAGQQAALAERGPAVGVAERLGFFIQVEGLHVGREDHLGGLVVKCLVVADAVGAAGALEARPLEPVEQAQPAAEAVGADPGLGVLGRLSAGSGRRTARGPRRESPRRWSAPPMLTMCGRSNWLSPSSLTIEQPRCGCLIVADGT